MCSVKSWFRPVQVSKQRVLSQRLNTSKAGPLRRGLKDGTDLCGLNADVRGTLIIRLCACSSARVFSLLYHLVNIRLTISLLRHCDKNERTDESSAGLRGVRGVRGVKWRPVGSRWPLRTPRAPKLSLPGQDFSFSLFCLPPPLPFCLHSDSLQTKLAEKWNIRDQNRQTERWRKKESERERGRDKMQLASLIARVPIIPCCKPPLVLSYLLLVVLHFLFVMLSNCTHTRTHARNIHTTDSYNSCSVWCLCFKTLSLFEKMRLHMQQASISDSCLNRNHKDTSEFWTNATQFEGDKACHSVPQTKLPSTFTWLKDKYLVK